MSQVSVCGDEGCSEGGWCHTTVPCSPDIVHKYVRDLYSKRFPELESLVHTPLEYCRSVKVCAQLDLAAVL